jgi:hypothetical protein
MTSLKKGGLNFQPQVSTVEGHLFCCKKPLHIWRIPMVYLSQKSFKSQAHNSVTSPMKKVLANGRNIFKFSTIMCAFYNLY